MIELEKAQQELMEKIADDQVPVPVGYQLLIMLPKLKDTFGDSRIVRPDSHLKEEQQASMIGLVTAMGPDAYKDTTRFTVPWCKVGDLVIFSTYAGTRIRVNGIDFRLMNDDTIKATIKDPSLFQRG